jgi:hypothetical protein
MKRKIALLTVVSAVAAGLVFMLIMHGSMAQTKMKKVYKGEAKQETTTPPMEQSKASELKKADLSLSDRCDPKYVHVSHVDKPEDPVDFCNDYSHSYLGIGSIINGKRLTKSYSCEYKRLYPPGDPCLPGSHIFKWTEKAYICRADDDHIPNVTEATVSNICAPGFKFAQSMGSYLTMHDYPAMHDYPEDGIPNNVTSYKCFRDFPEEASASLIYWSDFRKWMPHVCGLGKDYVLGYGNDGQICCLVLEPFELSPDIGQTPKQVPTELLESPDNASKELKRQMDKFKESMGIGAVEKKSER